MDDDEEMVTAGVLCDPGKGTEEALNLKAAETIHRISRGKIVGCRNLFNQVVLLEVPRMDGKRRHQIPGMEDHGYSGIFL